MVCNKKTGTIFPKKNIFPQEFMDLFHIRDFVFDKILHDFFVVICGGGNQFEMRFSENSGKFFRNGTDCEFLKVSGK